MAEGSTVGRHDVSVYVKPYYDAVSMKKVASCQSSFEHLNRDLVNIPRCRGRVQGRSGGAARHGEASEAAPSFVQRVARQVQRRREHQTELRTPRR